MAECRELWKLIKNRHYISGYLTSICNENTADMERIIILHEEVTATETNCHIYAEAMDYFWDRGRILIYVPEPRVLATETYVDTLDIRAKELAPISTKLDMA